MSCFMRICKSGKEEHKNGAVVPFGGADMNGNGGVQEFKRRTPWVYSDRFHNVYTLGEMLGSGAFAVVHEGFRNRDPEKPFAVKIIARGRLSRKNRKALRNEIQILTDLQHDNIITLHEVYEDDGYYMGDMGFYYLVMEKLNGGELFDRMVQKDVYTEKEVRLVCRTILEAMHFCHTHKVAHRDLKPENLLLKSLGSDTAIKIADFGFAKRIKHPKSRTTRCGSCPYIAPEIINNIPYDERCDNWSVGVIMFTLLGGYPPFRERTVHDTYQQIRQGAFQFHPEYWDVISKDAKDLILSLLTVDMDKRSTMEEALIHPWMTGCGVLEDINLAPNLKRFKTFNVERKQQGPVRCASYFWLLSRR